MDPLASTRISICWPPEPAGEPEDVLVISGRHGFYLDLRIDKATCSTSSTPTPRQASGTVDPRIGWATAGRKEFLPLEPGEEHPRARFTALLDSRLPPSSSSSSSSIPDAAAPPDEGSFSPLPNGDVLETGSMLRPSTGLVAPYEEVWRRLPVAPDARVVFLELVAGQHAQAYVGRVGDYELGLVRDAEGGFGAVRRERRSGEDGRWETVFEAGEGARLPSLAGFDVPHDGATEVELAGRTWRVIEAS
ncbi:hypothetical protein JCM8208_000340 [Rhodotorula glutinis]